MHVFRTAFCLVLAVLLGACEKAYEPVLGMPQTLENPTAGDVSGPRFSTGSDSRLALSWMEPGESGTTLRYSPLVNGEFQDPVDVTTEPAMFVNWADLPSVSQMEDDHWVAHWLRYSAPKTYSYDVVVSQSFDDGKTWSSPLTAHTDGTPTEHGFVSTVLDVDGTSLLWLDGRNTPDQSMTLRSAVITRDGRRIHEQEIDNSVCDCCQTDIAIAENGPIAVYRDRSSEEIRDIYVTRFTHGRWQSGERLYADNWHIPGCPVNGPSIVANGQQVAVAWFSAAADQPIVRVIRSTDSGDSFGKAVEIASGRISGYVGLAMLDDDSVAVSWVATNEDRSNSVLVRHIDAAGHPGPAIRLGQSSQLRLFPQLAYVDGHLYVAWTDQAVDKKILKLVRLTVSRRNQSS